MALLEQEFQREKNWVSAEQYAEMFAVTKLLPGPIATQQAIFLGRIRAGVAGGLVAGFFYILPAFLLMMGLSVLYVDFARSSSLTSLAPLLSGFQIGVLAIILMSVWNMSKVYQKGYRNWILISLSAVTIGMSPRLEPFCILSAGLIGVFLARNQLRSPLPARENPKRRAGDVSLKGLLALPWISLNPLLWKVFWVCFKAGAFVFGTGLAIVPLLEHDTVHQYGWLTHSQFMDGLALGQVTPGPIVITSTFVGYLAAGFWGGVVATLGMFLPSFINVLILIPLFWGRWSGSPTAKGFSSWSFPVVIGGILGTTVRLGYGTLLGPGQYFIFVVALGALIRWRMPPWLLLPATGALSLAVLHGVRLIE